MKCIVLSQYQIFTQSNNRNWFKMYVSLRQEICLLLVCFFFWLFVSYIIRFSVTIYIRLIHKTFSRNVLWNSSNCETLLSEFFFLLLHFFFLTQTSWTVKLCVCVFFFFLHSSKTDIVVSEYESKYRIHSRIRNQIYIEFSC